MAQKNKITRTLKWNDPFVGSLLKLCNVSKKYKTEIDKFLSKKETDRTDKNRRKIMQVDIASDLPFKEDNDENIDLLLCKYLYYLCAGHFLNILNKKGERTINKGLNYDILGMNEDAVNNFFRESDPIIMINSHENDTACELVNNALDAIRKVMYECYLYNTFEINLNGKIGQKKENDKKISELGSEFIEIIKDMHTKMSNIIGDNKTKIMKKNMDNDKIKLRVVSNMNDDEIDIIAKKGINKIIKDNKIEKTTAKEKRKEDIESSEFEGAVKERIKEIINSDNIIGSNIILSLEQLLLAYLYKKIRKVDEELSKIYGTSISTTNSSISQTLSSDKTLEKVDNAQKSTQSFWERPFVNIARIFKRATGMQDFSPNSKKMEPVFNLLDTYMSKKKTNKIKK